MSDKHEQLYGKWWVYRYNLARHVLKASSSLLNVMPPKDPEYGAITCLARFRLCGFDKPFEVVMDKVETGTIGSEQSAESNSWFGEKGSFDFRWEVLGPNMLTGYAADRHNPMYRDTFLAVRSPRTNTLRMEGLYEFECSYLTPLARTRRLEKRLGVSVRLGENRIIMSEKDPYTHQVREYKYEIIKNIHPYNGGRKLIGEYNERKDYRGVGLWLLPTDDSDQLLAIGHYFHELHTGDPTVPSSPKCQFTLQLC